ncbi:AAA domain-containing protein [Yinghuangia seranimata]|uniref:AAA domain-containing protein n=1 Tax=Yinghuangia seranimata TaxID=408067 RepID=UPI00248AC1F1|nr:AAA domain-containing protein [Yinghuangia seranimata]MDI2127204.1 AAA domain-containing protein [Yinghuangia seranimata]
MSAPSPDGDDPAPHAAGSRERLVHDALRTWTDQLVDPGGRNPLLFFRDLRAGTLDLADADPRAVDALLAGEPQRISRLFPGDERADAAKRARTVHAKTQELAEERGIHTAYLVTAMATWDAPDAPRPPASPVLLWPVESTRLGAGDDDFTLQVAPEAEANLSLLHVLKREFGVELDAEALAEAAASPADQDAAVQMMREATARVPGFAVSSRRVVGNFSYAKLPMVQDLERAGGLLASHDLVAAIAGDRTAADLIRRDVPDVDVRAPDAAPPRDEFLVLDADSSQSYVINAVVAGRHLVVEGPPGTGKSQTIANLVATLAARGQKVLFVAEKRAAIDAVVGRLRNRDLAELVLDLHSSAADRKRIVRSLGQALQRAGNTPLGEHEPLHRRLADRRERLNRHAALMNTPVAPWGVTLFEAQSACLATAPDDHTHSRLGRHELGALHGEAVEDLRDELQEFATLGGFDRSAEGHPWLSAVDTVTSLHAARQAAELVRELRTEALPAARRQAEEIAGTTPFAPPANPVELRSLVDLFAQAADTLAYFRPDVFAADLPALAAATGTGRWRKEHNASQGWGERRRLARDAGRLTHTGRHAKPELHAALLRAATLREAWEDAGGGTSTPAPPSDPGVVDRSGWAVDALEHCLGELAKLLPGSAPLLLTFDQLGSWADELHRDTGTLQRLPRLYELRRALTGYGLAPLLKELAAKRADATAAVASFDFTYHSSILDAAAFETPEYAAFEAGELDLRADEYRTADRDHIAAGPDRVQRAVAEHLYETLNARPEQAALVKAQANRKRGIMSMRNLVRQAPDVLTALHPCWAMSPLLVSEVLPLRRMFDVVIFDEASQVVPAEAMPSIMRADRVVVAGDRNQLPPTAFFSRLVDDEPPADGRREDDQDDDAGIDLTRGFESILDVMSSIVAARRLTWHYRSRDERLIAFSNAHIYDGSLTTFPGTLVDGSLRHVLVPDAPALPGRQASGTPEVEEVVRQVLAHARTRPDETLGVITMGIEHANRVDAALRRALSDRPDLDGFFSEARAERFFVKNLERVQGDERDAIILSIGYGKTADGRMLYRFGPLNNDGGERRLNVAVTRARRRMTTVSAFSAHDMDPARLTRPGPRLLRGYLEFAASGGHDLGAVAAERPALNPFEIDVRDRLTAAGIPLQPQYGVSGYWIDFAAKHPTRPGLMVLAIEADGATYHSSPTARDRDRLRQEQLERQGWRFHRIWSTAWFRNPEAEVARARRAYDKAVAAADLAEKRAAVAAAGAPVVSPSLPPPLPPESRPASATIPPQRTGRCPRPVPGQAITAYPRRDLVDLVRWIESDTLLRTEDEVVRQASEFLGYRRLGGRIRDVLGDAVREARRR